MNEEAFITMMRAVRSLYPKINTIALMIGMAKIDGIITKTEFDNLWEFWDRQSTNEMSRIRGTINKP